MNQIIIRASLPLVFLLLLYRLASSQVVHQEFQQNAVAQSAQQPRENGDATESEQGFRAALERHPRDAGLKIQFAHFLSQSGRFPEAIDWYQQALARSPRDQDAELGLAESFRQVHNIDEARAILRAARKQYPRSVAVLSALGSLEIDTRSYDAAIEPLQKAVEVAPANTKVRNLLATAYLAKGDSENALAQLNKVLNSDPDNGLARFLRAQIYADSNENEKALLDAEKVAAARPDYLPGRELLAKILLRLKRCESAANILRPAVNPPALETESFFLLANAYECAGHKELAENAREDFAKASQEDRKRAEDQVQSLHLVEQANDLAKQNKLSEALQLLDQAIEKNPQNGFAYSQQAKIYFSMQQTEKASLAIQRALQIQAFQPDFLYVAGVIAERSGQLDEALAKFEDVIHINPQEADAYYEMGQIWMQKKERKKALAAFRKAVEIAPEDADYKKAAEAAVSAGASSP